MKEFSLFIGGHVYIAKVYHYQHACPMRVTGSGFGDAEPPVDEEIEFDLFDGVGRPVNCDTLIACAEEGLLEIYRK